MRRRISLKMAVGVVFIVASVMVILDSTIVTVALPSIARSFGVPAASVDVVVVSYLASVAVFIPASGWLGDRFGGKRVLMIAVLFFTASSAACGMTTGLAGLGVTRALQGAAGGMLTPVAMAMFQRAFPPEERVRSAAVLTLPTALAPAIGPVLGGVLVGALSWRWVFFVNVPVGAALLLFAAVFLEAGSNHRPDRFDRLGFALSGLGLGSLVIGLSLGPQEGWTSTLPLATVVAGTAVLAAAIVVEWRAVAPVLALRLFRNRLFRAANVVMVLAAAGHFGALYLTTLFFQDVRGLTPLESGLSTVPQAVGVLVGAQLATRWLYPALKPRRHILLGVAVTSAAIALMAAIGQTTSLWWARADLFALGCGMAQIFVPAQAIAFATIRPASAGRASTLFITVRQLGGALGVAGLTTVLVTVGGTGGGSNDVSGFRIGYLVAAGSCFLGLVAGRTIRDSEAAATIPPRPAERRSLTRR